MIRSTFIAGFPGETEEEFQHLLDFVREAQIDRAGCFAYSDVTGAVANELPGMLPWKCARSAAPASWRWPKKCRLPSCSAAWAPPCRCWWDAPAMGRKGWRGRSYADAPRSMVPWLLPPEKISKQLKVGEFTKARIVAVQGHDLVAGCQC